MLYGRLRHEDARLRPNGAQWVSGAYSASWVTYDAHSAHAKRPGDSLPVSCGNGAGEVLLLLETCEPFLVRQEFGKLRADVLRRRSAAGQSRGCRGPIPTLPNAE
jgi:hypothetical protein